MVGVFSLRLADRRFWILLSANRIFTFPAWNKLYRLVVMTTMSEKQKVSSQFKSSAQASNLQPKGVASWKKTCLKTRNTNVPGWKTLRATCTMQSRGVICCKVTLLLVIASWLNAFRTRVGKYFLRRPTLKIHCCWGRLYFIVFYWGERIYLHNSSHLQLRKMRFRMKRVKWNLENSYLNDKITLT